MPHKGYKQDFNHTENIRKARLGTKRSKETCQNLSDALKGRKRSLDSIKKTVESRKWYSHSLETRKKISVGNIYQFKKPCVQCGKLFIVRSCEINRKYCSKQCYTDYGKTHSKKQRFPIICKICGNKVFLPLHRARKQKYCSNKCVIKYMHSLRTNHRFDYKGDLFRSKWEITFAEWCDNNDVMWKYEPKTFKLKDGIYYTPDFFLLEYNIFVEIKGYWFKNAREKCNLFGEKFSLLIIDDIKKIEEKFMNHFLTFEDNLREECLVYGEC